MSQSDRYATVNRKSQIDMSEIYEFEEEEFTTEFNGRTFLRILSQAKPHWPMMAGFLLCITAVAVIESTNTFLGKQIIDQGIIPGDRSARAVQASPATRSQPPVHPGGKPTRAVQGASGIQASGA